MCIHVLSFRGGERSGRGLLSVCLVRNVADQRIDTEIHLRAP